MITIVAALTHIPYLCDAADIVISDLQEHSVSWGWRHGEGRMGLRNKSHRLRWTVMGSKNDDGEEAEKCESHRIHERLEAVRSPAQESDGNPPQGDQDVADGQQPAHETKEQDDRCVRRMRMERQQIPNALDVPRDAGFGKEAYQQEYGGEEGGCGDKSLDNGVQELPEAGEQCMKYLQEMPGLLK